MKVHRWPLIIIGGFLILFVVDGAFIWIAVNAHEEPLPSYANTQQR